MLLFIIQNSLLEKQGKSEAEPWQQRSTMCPSLESNQGKICREGLKREAYRSNRTTHLEMDAT